MMSNNDDDKFKEKNPLHRHDPWTTGRNTHLLRRGLGCEGVRERRPQSHLMPWCSNESSGERLNRAGRCAYVGMFVGSDDRAHRLLVAPSCACFLLFRVDQH